MQTRLLFILLLATGVHADNWPHWRGPLDNGNTAAPGPFPVKWDAATNVRWQTALPGRGCSTPIIWNNRIVLTAPVEGKDAVLAFDLAGKPLWQTALGSERIGKHRNGSGSNPSPVTDGQMIFAYFKSGTLAALDWAGKLLWQTNVQAVFGKDTLYWDIGTSPVVTEQDVVMAVLHHGDSGLIAFNKRTGTRHWLVARQYQTAVEGDHSYATPLVIQDKGRETLIVLGGERLTAHAAADGKLLWVCDGFNPKAKNNWVPVASPVLAGNMLVVPYARGTCLHGINLAGHRVWQRADTGAFCPTPAARNGRVYLVRDRGEVECLDPATGKSFWTGRLPENNNHYYASPLLAGDQLYAAREDGVVYVVNITGKFALLAENIMGDRLIASPVPLGNQLLLFRGEKNLFCIGAK